MVEIEREIGHDRRSGKTPFRRSIRAEPRLTLCALASIRAAILKWTRFLTPAAAQRACSVPWGSKRNFPMSRRCELTAKGPQVGHRVSHSNIKTKRRFLPNLVNVTFLSDALGRSVRLRVSTNALKSVDHNGGLDAFLLKANIDNLSLKAAELKRQIEKKKAETASAAA